MIKQLLGR